MARAGKSQDRLLHKLQKAFFAVLFCRVFCAGKRLLKRYLNIATDAAMILNLGVKYS